MGRAAFRRSTSTGMLNGFFIKTPQALRSVFLLSGISDGVGCFLSVPP